MHSMHVVNKNIEVELDVCYFQWYLSRAFSFSSNIASLNVKPASLLNSSTQVNLRRTDIRKRISGFSRNRRKVRFSFRADDQLQVGRIPEIRGSVSAGNFKLNKLLPLDLFYAAHTCPVWVNFPLWASTVRTTMPLASTRNYTPTSSAHHHALTLKVLDRQQLDEWSLVQPTRFQEIFGNEGQRNT